MNINSKINRTEYLSHHSSRHFKARNADGYFTFVMIHSLLLILLCNLNRNRSDVDVFSSSNIIPQSFPSYQHLSFTRRYVADVTLTQQVVLPYTMKSESESLATRFAHSKFCVRGFLHVCLVVCLWTNSADILLSISSFDSHGFLQLKTGTNQP
jgi:hypothetical protein